MHTLLYQIYGQIKSLIFLLLLHTLRIAHFFFIFTLFLILGIFLDSSVLLIPSLLPSSSDKVLPISSAHHHSSAQCPSLHGLLSQSSFFPIVAMWEYQDHVILCTKINLPSGLLPHHQLQAITNLPSFPYHKNFSDRFIFQTLLLKGKITICFRFIFLIFIIISITLS